MSDMKALLEEYVQPPEPTTMHELRPVGTNLIVKWVMAIYVFSIFVSLLCPAYRGIYFKEDVFDSIAEIIKVAVVPVVTFVIGYYFAYERDREGIVSKKLKARYRSGPLKTRFKVKNPEAPAATRAIDGTF